MAPGKTEQDYIEEANAIIARLAGSVWYQRTRVRRLYEMRTEYHIFRKGMGFVARRNSVVTLVKFLKAQIPEQP